MKRPPDQLTCQFDEPYIAADRTAEKPLVSIVIPCFNNEAYVAEAIDSALGQTYDNIEVIVIDDGSTDGSLDIIRSYSERIIWRSGPNRGACAARNYGLDIASGVVVKFLDADDVLSPRCLDVQVRQLCAYSDPRDIVVGDHMVLDCHGARSNTRLYPCQVEPGCQFKFAQLFENGPLTTEPLHRTAILRWFGGFRPDVKRGQEHELHLRLFAGGIRFWYEPVPCYYYRTHASESRISIGCRNKGHFNRPEALIELADALQVRFGLLTSETRELLAHRAWRHARGLLRAGEAAEADQLFRAAQYICPDNPMVGSPLYRWLCKLGGPRLAEKAGLVTTPFHMPKRPE